MSSDMLKVVHFQTKSSPHCVHHIAEPCRHLHPPSSPSWLAPRHTYRSSRTPGDLKPGSLPCCTCGIQNKTTLNSEIKCLSRELAQSFPDAEIKGKGFRFPDWFWSPPAMPWAQTQDSWWPLQPCAQAQPCGSGSSPRRLCRLCPFSPGPIPRPAEELLTFTEAAEATPAQGSPTPSALSPNQDTVTKMS